MRLDSAILTVGDFRALRTPRFLTTLYAVESILPRFLLLREVFCEGVQLLALLFVANQQLHQVLLLLVELGTHLQQAIVLKCEGLQLLLYTIMLLRYLVDGAQSFLCQRLHLYKPFLQVQDMLSRLLQLF